MGYRKRERDPYALSCEEKGAKSVGIYSTNASAQRELSPLSSSFFTFLQSPALCLETTAELSPLPEQQFCLHILVKNESKRTQSGHLSERGTGLVVGENKRNAF